MEHGEASLMKKSTVKFWGVRGSIPAPGPNTAFYGGNTSCVEVRIHDQIIILDAGTGIRALGKSLISEFGGKPMNLSLLITHTHWDHIQGFPYFLPAYNPKNNISIFGFDSAGQGLEKALSAQMQTPYFPVKLEKMSGNVQIHDLKELQFKINKVPVKAHFLNHPGICSAYRIFAPEGSVSYLPDVELPCRSAKAALSKAILEQEDKLIEFLQGTDILIVDSQYDTSEYEAHSGWGHACIMDSVALALRAKARHLFLFHHDPDHTDEQIHQMVAEARQFAKQNGSSMLIDAAREGLEVGLGKM